MAVTYKLVDGVVEIFRDGTLVNAAPEPLLIEEDLWLTMCDVHDRIADFDLALRQEIVTAPISVTGTPGSASVVIESRPNIGRPGVLITFSIGSGLKTRKFVMQGWRFVDDVWGALSVARARFDALKSYAARTGRSVWDEELLVDIVEPTASERRALFNIEREPSQPDARGVTGYHYTGGRVPDHFMTTPHLWFALLRLHHWLHRGMAPWDGVLPMSLGPYVELAAIEQDVLMVVDRSPNESDTVTAYHIDRVNLIGERWDEYTRAGAREIKDRLKRDAVPGYPSAGVNARGNRGGRAPRPPRLLEQVDAAASAWRDETHAILRELIDVLKETTTAYAKGLVTFHDGTGEIVTRGATILMLEIIERLQRSMQEHRDVLAQRDLRIENLLVENAALLEAHGQARVWEERCSLLSGENLALKREIDPLRRLAAAHDAKVIESAELRAELQSTREELDDREEEITGLLQRAAVDEVVITEFKRLRSIWGIDMVDTEASE